MQRVSVQMIRVGRACLAISLEASAGGGNATVDSAWGNPRPDERAEPRPFWQPSGPGWFVDNLPAAAARARLSQQGLNLLQQVLHLEGLGDHVGQSDGPHAAGMDEGR